LIKIHCQPGNKSKFVMVMDNDGFRLDKRGARSRGKLIVRALNTRICFSDRGISDRTARKNGEVCAVDAGLQNERTDKEIDDEYVCYVWVYVQQEGSTSGRARGDLPTLSLSAKRIGYEKASDGCSLSC
jgi:hypothetical protein